jgi:hypothetical protein
MFACVALLGAFGCSSQTPFGNEGGGVDEMEDGSMADASMMNADPDSAMAADSTMADSGGSSDAKMGSDAIADSGCVADASATCAGLCGLVLDACNKIVNCGGCQSPDTCGGGGVQNMCGCTSNPKMTTCAGKCGMVLDNCKMMVDCGGCTLPDTCGGGGVANVCGCTDNGKACGTHVCGTATNNCGKTVSCGTCSINQPKCCLDHCTCANCACQ